MMKNFTENYGYYEIANRVKTKDKAKNTKADSSGKHQVWKKGNDKAEGRCVETQQGEETEKEIIVLHGDIYFSYIELIVIDIKKFWYLNLVFLSFI